MAMEPGHIEITETPVLIVGAGPAGLTTAITLAHQGVASLLVERRAELSGLPRATGVSTRTMELVRSWGIEATVRAGEIEAQMLMRSCETLAAVHRGISSPGGYPTFEQSAVISPTTPSCVPQDHLEPVLLHHLRGFPHARVEMGTEVVGIDQRVEGVKVTLRDTTTGSTRVVEARYAVAADGAHSRVRAGLGIAMHGPDHLAEVITVLFRAPLMDVVRDHVYAVYGISEPEAAGAFVPAGRDRWIYGVEWQPAHQSVADFPPERLVELIRRGAGVADLPVDIVFSSNFSFAAQLAERFREGDTFLIGDAAHRVTPRGATGMNTAIHDGFDLGWKLAWVLNGWADPGFLDSYEAERRPVAEHNVIRSADPQGSYRAAEEELRADLGGRLPHLWVAGPAGRLSTLDLIGPGLTVLTGPQRGAWDEAAARFHQPIPVDVQHVDLLTARALGISRDGALIVRPDGATAGWSPRATHALPALHAADPGPREMARRVA
jgi:putative polyketide hydroxylase